MVNEEHMGSVIFDGKEFPAALHLTDEKISINISGLLIINEKDLSKSDWPKSVAPSEIELLNFKSSIGSSTSLFSLYKLHEENANFDFSGRSDTRFHISFALKGANFENFDEICSDNWKIDIEDIDKIHNCPKFEDVFDVDVDPSGKAKGITSTYYPSKPVIINCPSCDMKLELWRSLSFKKLSRNKQLRTFSYPINLNFTKPVDFNFALNKIYSVRKFFSFLFGRILDINSISMHINDNGIPATVDVYGFRKILRYKIPSNSIVHLNNISELSPLLDKWLEIEENIKLAVNLHYQGLELKQLNLSLQFQFFIQAIEALHRKTVSSEKQKDINTDKIYSTLRQADVPKDICDRIKGMLAHINEPGLRTRLKSYWDLFSEELTDAFPAIKKNDIINKLVETRNYYAHRPDKSENILTGYELLRAVNIVKMISHLAILKEIGVDTKGIGKIMKKERFIY